MFFINQFHIKVERATKVKQATETADAGLPGGYFLLISGGYIKVVTYSRHLSAESPCYLNVRRNHCKLWLATPGLVSVLQSGRLAGDRELVTLYPHGHDNILERIITGYCDKRTAVGIPERKLDGFAVEVIQHIQQIADVETDIERVTAVYNFQLFLCLLLLAIIANDPKVVFCQDEAHAAEFFVRQD